MDTIDMDELEQELRETRVMFQRWSTSSIKAIQECKSTHLSRLRTAKGEITSLEDRYRKAEKKIADVRACMSQDEEQAVALQQKADLLSQEQRSLESQLAELQRLLEGQIEERDAKEADVKQQQQEQAERLRGLYKTRSAYEDCLGLKLIPGDDDLTFEFTQINPSQPEQPFRFAVKVNPDKSYKVTSCVPEVEGWQELAAELLQRQHSMASFVVAMRKKFRSLCST